MRIRVLASIVVIAVVARGASAHPGHGMDESGLVHWLTDLYHVAIPAITVTIVGGLLWTWIQRRRANSSISEISRS